MQSPNTQPSRSRPAIVEWLVRANKEVSTWAASMSWWRLALLILIILIAGSMVSEALHLRHGTERIVQSRSRDGKEDVDVTVFGDRGIHIIRRNGGPPPIPKLDASGATGTDATPTPANPPSAAPDDDDDDEAGTGRKVRTVTRQVFTFRGFVGDLGSALMALFFAYLVASKIVVRKVAESDAKVRSAVDAAEHEAMQRQLVQARLQVLQAQVEPHFLFNTLAAVDYLIETDPPRASEMQKALITYLRGALPQMRLESSTLGRELKLIRSYLELIKMRIEDRLDVEFAVPEGAESAEFPPMMLQSVVENAIKHGIEPKPEGGKVSVAARIQNGQLWVEVRDTGVGIPDTSRLEGPTSGTGIGIQNIRERLAMLYPGKSRLIIMSDDRVGTTVKIVVPYQVGPETVANFDGNPARSAA